MAMTRMKRYREACRLVLVRIVFASHVVDLVEDEDARDTERLDKRTPISDLQSTSGC